MVPTVSCCYSFSSGSGSHLSLFNNATIALLVAQKVLNFSGEIITTPFSFIATAHSIKWNGLEPVFVDTDNYIGNLDPKSIESAITKKWEVF